MWCRARTVLVPGAISVMGLFRRTSQAGNLYNYILIIVYGTTYTLVQAYRPKLRPSQMPHAIATRMSRIWYHTDHHEQRKWVTQRVLPLRA